MRLTNSHKLFEAFYPGSPEYVVLHARYRASRGKRPSAWYKDSRNPRMALKMAKDDLREPRSMSHRRLDIDTEDLWLIMKILGIQYRFIGELIQELLALKPEIPIVPYLRRDDGMWRFAFGHESLWEYRPSVFAR